MIGELDQEGLQEILEDFEALVMDEFEDALVGAVERCGEGYVACYDVAKIIDILVSQGLTYEDAVEHFGFNIAGAWVGKKGPVFLHRKVSE